MLRAGAPHRRPDKSLASLVARVCSGSFVGSVTIQRRPPVDHVSAECQPATMAQRERYIFVCTNRRHETHEKGSCAARGSEAVHQALKEQLKAGGLAKLQARVCASSCLDQCSVGVTILVEPDHYFYGRVTEADVPEIVAAVANDGRVERLVMSAEDLARG